MGPSASARASGRAGAAGRRGHGRPGGLVGGGRGVGVSRRRRRPGRRLAAEPEDAIGLGRPGLGEGLGSVASRSAAGGSPGSRRGLIVPAGWGWPARAAARPGHCAAAAGLIAAICCQARDRACRAAGCSGTTARTASAAERIAGHFPSESAAYSASTLGMAAFCRVSSSALAAAAACWAPIAPAPAASRSARSSCSCARPNSPRRPSASADCQASAISRVRRRAGPLTLCRARSSIRSSALRRVAGVQVGADLLGHPVGQAQPGRGQRIGRGAHPLGQVQVLDGAAQVVDRAAAGRPGDQVQRQPAAELHRIVVVRDVGAGRQGKCLLEPPHSRGLLSLPQHDPPLSQHG